MRIARDLGIDVGTSSMVLIDVEVTPTDEPPFKAAIGTLQSRLMMYGMQRGTVLRVRYDPKDHSRLMVEE